MADEEKRNYLAEALAGAVWRGHRPKPPRVLETSEDRWNDWVEWVNEERRWREALKRGMDEKQEQPATG